MFADVQGRPEDPVLIVNHPSNKSFTAYFDQAMFDEATATGKKTELWSTNFDAVEVWQGDSFEESRDKSVKDWFAQLNAGHTMWATGSSDTHHIRSSAPGYPRTCLYFGHDDPTKLTANTVRDVLAKGVATASGGLFMTVEGPGGAKPGSTVPFTFSRAMWLRAIDAPPCGASALQKPPTMATTSRARTSRAHSGSESRGRSDRAERRHASRDACTGPASSRRPAHRLD